jgi:glutamyl/glutaminyl-tRNA synthetase
MPNVAFQLGWEINGLRGLRRRGYTPASIRSFCDRIGVAKVYSTVDYAFLEHCLREDLNASAKRVMAVLRPDGSPHTTAIWSYRIEGGQLIIHLRDGRIDAWQTLSRH